MKRGDVSFANFWLLPYLENEIVIVLMRDREETVESILNHPTNHYFNKAFPWFDFNKREDVEQYYDWYYESVLEYDPIIIDPSQIPIRANVSMIQ